MTRMPHRSRTRGFTLIEVLVALSIVALALAAGARASGAMTANAQRQSDMLLAQLCAENTLIGLRLMRQMPPVGDDSQTCSQAGREWAVRISVRPTPNPNFVRVQAQVADGETPLLSLATIMGRY